MTLHAGLPGQLRSGRSPLAGRPARPRVLMTLLAALAAAAIAVTGCASGSSGGGASNGGSGSGGSTPAKVSLTFQVTHGPGSPAFQHWTLRCDPAGGTHPAASATCASLLKLKHPFAPQNKQLNCPMILRSDRRIVVKGTWFGQKVHRVVLDGGCDLGLYTKLHQIFH